MSGKSYNWKRFWVPRDGHIVFDDRGYPYDPEVGFGHIYNPDLRSLVEILSSPCLALLGEPGIGKTATLNQERARIAKIVEAEGGQVLWFNLWEYGDEDRLVREVFRCSAFDSWATGSHALHLFLDSLDECLLRVDQVATLLLEELRRKSSIDRLFFRIACRTAEWPNLLEDGLKGLYGEDKVKVYELAPLCLVDVAEAAKVGGVNSDAFLQELDKLGAVPLAIKPVTLPFLLNEYGKTASLPFTQHELYARGCRGLCEETSESRRSAQRLGRLTPDERFAVAARIAAVTIFANRAAVWTDIDRGDIPETDVTIEVLAGGKELANKASFEVTEDAVRETLTSGLFSSRGPHRLGWAHKTYAEFLAARYVIEHKMPLDRIKSLILHPGDPDHKVVPQLHETVAWIAGLDGSVFQYIRNADPGVLLRSDVTRESDREALVDTLLALVEEGKISEWDTPSRWANRNLDHQGLAGQLRPYMQDRKKSVSVRSAAIYIAEACRSGTLLSELVAIALDVKEPEPVRVAAAVTVTNVGDNGIKRKLLPLATHRGRGDPNDELKGCALRALWPENINAKDLFPAITRPKNERLVGVYRLFLEKELAPRLRPADLPLALRWSRKHALPQSAVWDALAKTVDAIMLQAWPHLDAPSVLKAFARVAFIRLRNHIQIVDDSVAPAFREMLVQDDNRRRSVLEAMLPLVTDPDNDGVSLVASPTPVALSKDVSWMIGKLRTTRSQKQAQLLVAMTKAAFDWRDSEHARAIYVASQEIPSLADAFTWFLKPVALKSPEAARMREEYEWQKAREEQRERVARHGPSPAQRIDSLLQACESGKIAAWISLNMEIALDQDGSQYVNEIEADLTALPVWETLDDSTRTRILLAAQQYLREQALEDKGWLGTNSYPRAELAGYRALRLLLKENRSLLMTLSASIWQKWAAIVLAYPTAGETSLDHELVALAHGEAPAEIINALGLLIDKEDRAGTLITVTRKLEGCWDATISNALLEKMRNEALKPECMGCLLSQLLDHDSREARDFAASLLANPTIPTGNARKRAVVAAEALMLHADDAGWSAVWPAIQRDAEFGRDIVSAAAYALPSRKITPFERLSEDQLADLYIWLVEQFPVSQDPKHDEAYWVGPRESVAWWRDALITYLKDRGTYNACNAIGRLKDAFPDQLWLRRVLAEAQATARRVTWVPPRPREIVQLATDGTSRLVQSGDQLCDVLIESVRRLENELQGETPAAAFLWNQIRKGTWRPKDERDLANYVKIHLVRDLTQRGIIVNREVEIRPPIDRSTGERTDIHVDAVLPGSRGEEYDRVSVIIEVKGCWHPELKEAMDTQLVNRYLQDNQCQHGLYLVGWFLCRQWDNNDSRKRQVPRLTLKQAREMFDVQAASLSTGGIRVRALIINAALRPGSSSG